ncbi:MAG: tRNA lysidine(34) synthetase TilS [Lactobacillales bacterium]|nr:tRNA lysidine(34) synthetase TilS [Lactobacillales bacterium]
MFKQKLTTHLKKTKLIDKNKRLLLAVSGGVDSMVLLHVFLELREEFHWEIGIAHVHHNLRRESNQEQAYLENFAQEHHLPFYSVKWEEGRTVKKGVEKKAREFRYAFFSDVMKEQHYDYLLTAHHQGDFSETMMMKWIRGSLLTHLIGIRSSQKFSCGKLVRPLLPFSKANLLEEAQNSPIIYFEDETNQSEHYFRNRVRNQLLPLLRTENPNIDKQLQQYGEKFLYLDDFLREELVPILEQTVTEEEYLIKIDLKNWQEFSRAKRYFLLTLLFEEKLIGQVEVNHAQVVEILDLLESSPSQAEIQLEKGWRFAKRYEMGLITGLKSDVLPEVFWLNEGIGLFLSQEEWLGTSEEQFSGNAKEWETYRLSFNRKLNFPLEIRHRRPKDEIHLQEKGYTKKVRRVFIDNKFLLEEREKTWLVFEQTELLWIVPKVHSYLSILGRNDKIMSELIYKRRISTTYK